MSVRLRDRDYRQSGLVHRHRVVPAIVVPFSSFALYNQGIVVDV